MVHLLYDCHAVRYKLQVNLEEIKLETHGNLDFIKLALARTGSNMYNQIANILLENDCCQIFSFVCLLVFEKLKDRPPLY